MASDQTPDRIRQERIDMMGQELGATYHELWNEVVWLHVKWAEFVQLYGTKKTRLDILNRAAGSFFHIVQKTFFHDALLHIARLTDRPVSFRKKNLSLLCFQDMVDDDGLKERLSSLSATMMEKVAFCRDWRNRYLAHTDYNLALRKEADALATASRDAVDEALEAMAAVMNAVSLHYLDSTVFYEDTIGAGDAAMKLIYTLYDGLEVGEQRKKRREAGEWPEDDEYPEL